MNWELVSYLVTIVLIKLTGTSLFLYYFPFPINDANNDKIEGGYTCQKSSFLYQVSLNANGHICGGSLINNQWVVSAASCHKLQFQVRLAGSHWSLNDGSEQYINSTKIIIHPSFNSNSFNNDIMLIKLSTPAITLNSQVTSVSLPTSCVTAGTECLIFGWSRNYTNYHDTLDCLKAPVVSSTECKNAYPGKITSNMICLKFLGDGKSPGKGDGGYPAVCNGKLQGLLSWGISHSRLEVYTKICNYISWIESTIESN